MATKEGQIKKINGEISKFMKSVNKKAKMLNARYYKILGQYSGSLNNVGFGTDEIQFYSENKNLKMKH